MSDMPPVPTNFGIGGSGKPLIAHGVIGRRMTVRRRDSAASPPFWTDFQGADNSNPRVPQGLSASLRALSTHTDVIDSEWRPDMKIVVIGGTGLIGTKLVARLHQKGHEVVAASPASGVNTITGEGLAEALAGTQIVVDLANSPSFEDGAVLKFFETSGRNLLAAEASAGVRHHVALSVVGTDRLPENGYFRAKLVQESLIKAAKIPYTILRATQFFEFVSGIVDSSADGQIIRLSPALFQPVASDDVAAALADITLAVPVNGIVELAGPERFSLDDFARQYLTATKDPRKVVADIHARYFGAELDDRSLTPGQNPRLGAVRFEDWLAGLRQ